MGGGVALYVDLLLCGVSCYENKAALLALRSNCCLHPAGTTWRLGRTPTSLWPPPAPAGLVGVPNAGKSSLLRALTAARPKVGSYAFTTLMPQLGVVDLGWGERMVIADVPGLIAGAAENRGLGHAFLKHVERTRALAYVLDASAGLHGATSCAVVVLVWG